MTATPLHLLQWLSRLTDIVVAFFFPQVVVNHKFPQQAGREPVLTRKGSPKLDKRGKPKSRVVRRWRWLHSRMAPEQMQWVAENFWEYWLRWAISWPFVMFLCAKVGPSGLSSGILLLWLLLAGWTFAGMLAGRWGARSAE